METWRAHVLKTWYLHLRECAGVRFRMGITLHHLNLFVQKGQLTFEKTASLLVCLTTPRPIDENYGTVVGRAFRAAHS